MNALTVAEARKTLNVTTSTKDLREETIMNPSTAATAVKTRKVSITVSMSELVQELSTLSTLKGVKRIRCHGSSLDDSFELVIAKGKCQYSLLEYAVRSLDTQVSTRSRNTGRVTLVEDESVNYHRLDSIFNQDDYVLDRYDTEYKDEWLYDRCTVTITYTDDTKLKEYHYIKG